MVTATTPETAYRALSYCAEQMGAQNYARLPEKIRKGREQGKPFPSNVVWPTPAHREVMDAMLDVMSGALDVESAMALLHRSDVHDERYGH